jgi:hypothetical protein
MFCSHYAHFHEHALWPFLFSQRERLTMTSLDHLPTPPMQLDHYLDIRLLQGYIPALAYQLDVSRTKLTL